MKRKLIFFLTLLGLFAFSKSYSQQLTPETIATSGDYFSNSYGSLSWTIGESLTKTFTSSASILTQGFQQPTANLTTVTEINDESQFSVYPNPCTDHIYISCGSLRFDGVTIKLYDASGRLLLKEALSDAACLHKIDLSAYASHCYFLALNNEKNKLMYSTIKIKR